jgi:hypothetical protein
MAFFQQRATNHSPLLSLVLLSTPLDHNLFIHTLTMVFLSRLPRRSFLLSILLVVEKIEFG